MPMRPGSPAYHFINAASSAALGALGGAALAKNSALGDVYPNSAPVAGGIAGGLAGLAGYVGHEIGRGPHPEQQAYMADRAAKKAAKKAAKNAPRHYGLRHDQFNR